MKEGQIHISQKERGVLEEILRSELEGELVFVFGSRVRGDHRDSSDLDIAILGSSPLPIKIRSNLEFRFSESDLPFRVDIVDLLTAEEGFKRSISAELIPFTY